MCWLRSEKMNWLLIRVALRGHRGETTHSLAISVNWGLSVTGPDRAGPGHRVWSWKPLNLVEEAASNMATISLSQTKDKTVYPGVFCEGLRTEWQRYIVGLASSGSLTIDSRPKDFELESYGGNI